jgi:hypothetical protein
LDEAGALTNIANIKDVRGDQAGAKKPFEESIAVARERGDQSGLALAQQNLATVLCKMDDARGGSQMFNDSIKLAGEIGGKKTEA